MNGKEKRRFRTASFTLASEQIMWLWSQPNASKALRELIDAAMEKEEEEFRRKRLAKQERRHISRK